MSACPHDHYCLCDPMTRAQDGLLRDLNRATYGDGGPLIVAPDWKATTAEALGLDAWLPKTAGEDTAA